MIKSDVLTVVWSEKMEILKQRAVAVMQKRDRVFAAELSHARKNEDRSIISRLALRQFVNAMADLSEAEWAQLASSYREHRNTFTLDQGRLRIWESGRADIETVRDFILNNASIYNVVVDEKQVGTPVPDVMAIIFALEWIIHD